MINWHGGIDISVWLNLCRKQYKAGQPFSKDKKGTQVT